MTLSGIFCAMGCSPKAVAQSMQTSPRSPKVSDKAAESRCVRRSSPSPPPPPQSRGLEVAPCQKKTAIRAIMKRELTKTLQVVDDALLASRRHLPSQDDCSRSLTSPSLSAMSTTCSSMANSPRRVSRASSPPPQSPAAPLRSGSRWEPQRSPREHKPRARDGLMPCQRARAARAQSPTGVAASSPALAGASPVDQTPLQSSSAANVKSRFDFSMAAVMSESKKTVTSKQPTRYAALAEARNAHKQKVASEARSKAFCKDMAVKLAQVRQTLRA